MRKYTLIAACLLVICSLSANAQNGVIKTIAGTGVAGFSGDGGPAGLAIIDSPRSVAIDHFGNIYFAAGNRIRKISTTGIISTIAGGATAGYTGDGGLAIAAKLNAPQGISVDVTGNIFIADYQNSCIRKINTTGIISTVAGTGVAGFNGDGIPATSAELNRPAGVAVDASGTLYISDTWNNRIRKITSSGIIGTFAGNGTYGSGGDGGPATAGQLTSPLDIKLDNSGNLYVADLGNNKVRKVNNSGIISTFAGNGTVGLYGDGRPATVAQLANPTVLTIDKSDNLFVGDLWQLRKVNAADGKIQTISGIGSNASLGDGGFSLTTSMKIAGLAVDTFNNIYIADFKHCRIRKICNFASVFFYFDANSNCIKDSSEFNTNQSVTIEVDSNGIAVDTISATSGFGYNTTGNVGDVYSFKLLTSLSGLAVACPASGRVNDTIHSAVGNYFVKDIGFHCTSAPGFDVALSHVEQRTGLDVQITYISVRNKSCNAVDGILTVSHSPKYLFDASNIPPISTTGNTISWSLLNLSDQNRPVDVMYLLKPDPSAALVIRDTVQTHATISPTAGDNNTGNNSIIIIDTVSGSCDPNVISVTPKGYIPSGTQLEYTIIFENVGNDTAFNIYVMDSLSDYVDPKSFRILAASANMNTTMLHSGTHNILKFDFPNINLLDTSHHGLCDGSVKYIINTYGGLPNGTSVLNHAGIYFDNNGVVMTNTVENIIGLPNKTALISNSKEISLYPNPATNQLTIKTEQNAYTSFTITNGMGQVLLQRPINSPQTNVDIKALASGLYYISLKGTEGNTMRKFVKVD